MQSRGKRGRSNSSSTARFVRRKTNIESLPDELLFDILIRLPAVFLHDRARLVCRRWNRIIQSRVFINAHFQQNSTYGLVLSLQSLYWPPRSTFLTATQGGRIETSELRNSYVSMATSCNGLTLQVRCDNAQVRGFSLHVINPATDQSFRLPSNTVFRIREDYGLGEQCGIAYSAASMEYKVTLPYYDDRRKSEFLYIVTVGVDKSWRHVENIPLLPVRFRSLLSLCPVSSEGFLHWVSWRYCLTMNVETEMFTTSEVPIPHSDYYSYDFLSTGRYLTLLIGRGDLSWEVWEMKPAQSGEWRKAGLPKIQLKARNFRQLNPIGWVKYPEVLAFSSPDQTKCIIFYNLETHEINSTYLSRPLRCYNRAFVHGISLAKLSQD